MIWKISCDGPWPSENVDQGRKINRRSLRLFQLPWPYEKPASSFKLKPGAEVWIQAFTEAYRQVAAGVIASAEPLENLFPELSTLFANGNTGQYATELVLKFLPAGTWRWPLYEEQFGDSDPEGMAYFFGFRTLRLTQFRLYRDRYSTSLEYLPYILFAPIDDDRTPGECLKLIGMVRNHSDPFWSENRIPCGRLDCRCSVIAGISAREAENLLSSFHRQSELR